MNKLTKRSGTAAARVDWNAVGRRLRELRGFDLTQQEFARRIGVSQNHLSTMERGKVEIGAEILLRIGLVFDKSLEWLLTGEYRTKDKTSKNLPSKAGLGATLRSYFLLCTSWPPISRISMESLFGNPTKSGTWRCVLAIFWPG
jgi:transcriptional regulator with XRE-family HTH domain